MIFLRYLGKSFKNENLSRFCFADLNIQRTVKKSWPLSYKKTQKKEFIGSHEENQEVTQSLIKWNFLI